MFNLANNNAKPIQEKIKFSTTMNPTSLDKAVVYLHNHSETEEGSVNPKTLLRKIDWIILPLAFLCYALQIVDKININYAAVMGMNEDLKLVGNDFSNAATALYIATFISEILTGCILQKVPPGKWLGINVILWGIVTASTATVKNYHGLLACRVLLGVFEAAMSPCLMLITGMWYTKPEAVRRFSVWFCGVGIGQIFGGFTSWVFQHFKGGSIEGWRVMFIVLGTLTISVGVLTIILMPDNQMSVKWLSDAEKAAAIRRVAANQTGIQNMHFKWSHLKELVFDMQIWLLVVLIALISVCSGVVTTYSATVIRNFGYSSPQAALLNMPSGLVSIASAIIAGYFVGKQSNRWLWISILCVPAVLGGGLMSFLPSTNKGGHLAGIYLVNAITPTLVLVYSWVAANVAGHTKRVFATALISAAFCIGSIIGPQTFQAKDAPEYIPAKIAVLATQSAAIMVAITARLYYGWQNSRREKVATTQKTPENIEWMNLTDKENMTFRYQY